MTQLSDDDQLSYRRPVADIYQAIGDPRAELANQLALDDDAHGVSELRELAFDLTEATEELRELWQQLPEKSPNAQANKHNDTCWQRHIACLANEIGRIMDWHAHDDTQGVGRS